MDRVEGIKKKMRQWKEWVEEYWQIIVCLSSIVFVVLLLLNTIRTTEDKHIKEDTQHDSIYEDLGMESFQDEEKLNEEEIKKPSLIMVDIKGAVNRPGVYEMFDNARLLDVIEKAGGFSEDADSRTVNLAQILTDQMMIYIPAEGEEISEKIQVTLTSEIESTKRININTADSIELTQLNGIGEARANSIIEYREENGRFKSIEEIKNVSGIGDSIFEGFKDEIVVQ